MNLADVFLVSALVFSEKSEGWWVKCFQKFPKGGGLNSLRKLPARERTPKDYSEIRSAFGTVYNDWQSSLVGLYHVSTNNTLL